MVSGGVGRFGENWKRLREDAKGLKIFWSNLIF